MHEYPPMLHGSTESQLRQLRDFLVRLVQKLYETEEVREK